MTKAGWRGLQKNREESHSKGGCPSSIWKSQDLYFPEGHGEKQPGFGHLERILTEEGLCIDVSKSQLLCCKAGPAFGYLLTDRRLLYPRKCPKLWPEAAGVVGDRRTVKRAGMIDI